MQHSQRCFLQTPCAGKGLNCSIMSQSGSQENLPLGIMRSSHGRPSQPRAVRINVPATPPPFNVRDLPSRADPMHAPPACVDDVGSMPPLVDMHEMPSRHWDAGGQRAPARRRTWAQQRSSAANVMVQSLPSHRGDHGDDPTTSRTPGMTLEQQASRIVTEMESDADFMEDNPQAEQLRQDTLKEMPEPLALKRTIRRKLMKTVSQKSKHSPISVWKRFKYRASMALSKTNLTVRALLYSFELWYQSLKVIEGHFGSGVATYFKFLRWLFLLNLLFCVMCVSFIVLPQLLYHPHDDPVEGNTTTGSANIIYQLFDLDDNSSNLVGITAVPVSTESPAGYDTRSGPDDGTAEFSFSDLFTGEGFFTDTTLYYGFYVNDTLLESTGSWYSIPNAYFFTAVTLYVFMFVVLSISMARSYRRSFIETAGGVKNVYAHKVFCGWDFSIASSESARLKSKSLFNELKELLGDDVIEKDRNSLNAVCSRLAVKLSISAFCVLLLAATAVLMWLLLASSTPPLVVSLVVTLDMILMPMLFSWLIKYEGYRSPRTALYITLLRTFALEAVIVAVLVAFWLTREVESAQCWETSLAQEVYRLVMMDFWLAIIGTAIAEFARSRIHKSVWAGVGEPEFNIARNTLNLIYNQTLFWIGAFFSPLLAVIIAAKMVVTFYVKKVCVLRNCRPSSRSWRASQTQTVFLVMTFVSLLGVVSTLGYILTMVRPSESCGPFRNLAYIYEIILSGVFQLGDGSALRKLIMYLTRPGVVGGILLAMGAFVYYLRAQSLARRAVVDILREMLKLEAKDKEFLLRNISKITDGQWMYNLNNDRGRSRPSPKPGANRADESRQGDQPDGRAAQASRGRGVAHSPSRRSGGGVSPTRRYSQEVSPSHRFSGRVSPTFQFSGEVSPRHQHSGRVSPTFQFSGEVSPRHRFSGRVSPTQRFSGVVSPTHRFSGDGDHLVMGHVPGRFGNRGALPRVRSADPSPASTSSSDEVPHFSGPDDRILELSDEELNKYESTRIRSLRRKHMKKY